MSAKGSLRLGLHVEGTVALSRLTEGWSDEEIQSLLAGGREAREEIDWNAIPLVMAEGEVEVDHSDLIIERKAAA